MSTFLFYLAAAVAVAATVRVITLRHPVHALLHLIVSLLAVATIFFLLGAPFAGVLEVILYAGAIMVLFVFVVMTLDAGAVTAGAGAGPADDRPRRPWLLPALLALILIAEVVYALAADPAGPVSGASVSAKEVGSALFGRYLPAVELAGLLLLAGLVGAFHLARSGRRRSEP